VSESLELEKNPVQGKRIYQRKFVVVVVIGIGDFHFPLRKENFK
jgi:hypothetical protein